VISFLSPLFLLGAAAVAVPILLHLLKRQPETRVRFSAVHLLRSAPVETTSQRRLRELLLLALRVTALLLLALAFARPFMAGAGAVGNSSVTIVALDTSLSMSAPGVFDRARQLARDAIRNAPAGDAVGLVTFADQAHVAAEPSGDRAIAAGAVDASQPGFSSTRYRAGLNAAADTFKGRPGRIVVVTDLLESGWDAGDRAAVPESTVIEVADVGAPPPNLSVTSARVSGNRIVASVHNAGPEPREARVHLTITGPDAEGRPAGDTTIPVGANQSAEVSLPIGPGRSAAVTVEDRQGLEGDNVRYVVLENAGRPKVLIVTATGDVGREAFYLQQALIASGPDGNAYDVVAVAAPDLSTWDQVRLDGFAAVALTSTKALDRHGRELISTYVHGGGGVLLTAGAEVDGEIVAEALGERLTMVVPSTAGRDMKAVSFAPADVRHPVFRGFGAGRSALGLVQFDRVTVVRADGCQTLARFTSGETALAECAPGSGRALILASDLDNRWNDFPLHSMFVPFVHEVTRYLTGGRPVAAEYLVDTVPAGISPTPGVVPVTAASGASRLVAVNVDAAETVPARLTAEEFGTAVTRLKEVAATEQQANAREQEDRQHIWQYVLALMLTMLVVESVIAMRTG
jgi:hypothetical protein